MQCPIDNTALIMTDRLGIEIDYCPECRGVWLDRGELDKIIERTNEQGSIRQQTDNDVHNNHNSSHRLHKKRSFISEVFSGFGDD